jgi:hypothetical protein
MEAVSIGGSFCPFKELRVGGVKAEVSDMAGLVQMDKATGVKLDLVL